MRIVAGRFKRRPLLPPVGEETTRPITDRAKEQLFEHLGGDLTVPRDGGGAGTPRVLDAFAGTGTIGLEALSRGAAGVVFLEQDRQTFDLLRQNVAKLGVEDETLTWRVDVFRTSFRPRDVPHLVPFDLLFFDPPYAMAPGIARGRPLFKSLERAARDGVSAEGARLVLRVPKEVDPDLPDVWVPYRELRVSGMKFLLCDRVTP